MSAVLLILAAATWFSGTAAATPQFASAENATIHPGVATTTAGDCTANFVFTNGTDVFLGQAAHCAGTGGPVATSGCLAESMPLGTPVTVQGASRPGTLAYSSWLTMQQIGETDSDTCAGNDFALVKLDPADVAATNPSLPVFGGPTGVDTDGAAPGESVYTYGNSSLRGGIEPLSPQSGITLETTNGGWTYSILTITPSLPGDSGSAVLSADGEALGVVVTLAIAPTTGSNGATDLSRALAYTNEHGNLGELRLVSGTEDFNASPLSLLGGLGLS
ncbi:MAG: trypsin-like peptidase domain-containing protein [Pseudonocardiaceae bacterium]